MKILWFTNNTVSLKKNTYSGGWMQSLEYYLTLDSNIQLSIATRSNGQKLNKIINDKTTYYLIPDKRNLIQKRLDLFLNKEPLEAFIKEYAKVIDEVSPDVIHVFGTEMDYGLVCTITNIPVVIHLQGILHPLNYQFSKIPISFFKKILSHSLLDYVKGSTLQNGLKIFKRRVGIEEKIYNQCQYFIGRTAWDKRVTKILAPNAKYFHCEEMLRSEFFESNWIGNADETISIVSTISNPIYKGHETIIATSKVLQKTGLNFIWHVIGIDKQSTAYSFFYKEDIKQLNHNIKLHNNLSPNEIIAILKTSNVYVHPSHIENSSNSLCEAMAIGMPTIALHVGGNESMIKDNDDGFLVPDNDPYNLAATIVELIKNKEKAIRLGRKAKQRAKHRHNKDNIIFQLKQIYLEISENYAHK